jgi:hypothetical protein
MSRRPKNLGLRQLLARKSKEWGEDACVLDMACTLTTSRRAIHLYTTGRRRFPLLEARMAEFFGVSVRTLRRKLGLPGATAAIAQIERLARSDNTIRSDVLRQGPGAHGPNGDMVPCDAKAPSPSRNLCGESRLSPPQNSQSQTPNQGAHHDSPSLPSRSHDPRHAG